jgi:SSS family solute:Na+ symporter
MNGIVCCAAAGAGRIGSVDVAVTIAYLLGIVVLGCWAGIMLRRRESGAKGYFLAGRSLGWPIIGMALFATNISCVHLVSLAQAGFDTGLLQGNFEWMAAFTLIMLSLFFAPFYIRSQVATLPDFLEKRYCRACRDWLAVLSIVSAVTIHIGFSFLTGGIVLESLFPGLDRWTSILVVAVLTGLYTIVGGLMAVVVTEAIQTVVLVVGATLITIFAWNAMGGWTPMLETLRESGEAVKATILRTSEESRAFPWYAIFLGYPVLGIWYWCAEQTIVQRVLGARDENHARVGPLFAGLIKVLPVFIFVMPGMFAFTLARTYDRTPEGLRPRLDISHLEITGSRDVWKAAERGELVLDEPALVDAGVLTIDTDKRTKIVAVDEALAAGLIDGTAAARVREAGEKVYDTKGMYGVMITQLMPTGLIGIMVAALLAALMSTVSGALNSISTLFSYDLYRRFRPAASDRQLVLVGRITAGLALVLAIGLVSLLDRYQSIFEGLNDIIAHIAPPVTCVFLLGVFWGRASAAAAKLTLWIGSALGAGVFFFNKLGPKTFLADIPFMMMAFYLLVVCIGLQVTFSFVYPVRHTEESRKLFWSTPFQPLRDTGWPFPGNYKFLTGLLFVIMCVLYYLFA